MESYSQDDQEASDDVCSRWFKMPSRLWDTEAGSDPYLCQLLAYLCDRARISDGPVGFGEGKGRRNFYLAAGEAIVGRLQAAKDLKCAPSSVRNRLERLKEIGLVTVRPCKNFSIVTIVFLVKESSKKKSPKKDSRKQAVHPTNSLTDAKTGEAKRTDEGQPKNDEFTNESPSETASTVSQKGQMKDRRRTDDGQMMDTNKKEKKVRRKEDERESPPPEFISAILEGYPNLPQSDRRRLTAEILGEIEFGKLPEEEAAYRLRQWIGATIARNAKAPKQCDIVTSSDPSDDPSTTTTTTTAPSVPAFNAPHLEYDVKPFFYKRPGDPLSYRYEDAATFNDFWRRKGWKRKDGSYIDWQAEALRPKAPPPIGAPSPSVPSAPVPSPSPSSSVSVLAAVPSPSTPAKSAAELQKVSP